MTKNILTFLAVCFISLSCEKEEELKPNGPSSRAIVINNVTTLGGNTYKITGEITNYQVDKFTNLTIVVASNSDYKTYDLGIPSGKDFEFVTDTLQGPTTYLVDATLKENELSSNVSNTFTVETDFPEFEFSNATVGDYYTVKVTGKRFVDGLLKFYVKSRSTPESIEKQFDVYGLTINDTVCSFRTPAIISTDPATPHFFGAEIQPCYLYVSNSEMTKSKLLGQLNFAYRFVINKTTGKVGDEFTITTFYSKQDPGADKLKIYFDETVRIPTNVQELFDFTTDGLIFGTRITVTVPFGSSTGDHQITILSPYDDEFIFSSNVFTVTP